MRTNYNYTVLIIPIFMSKGIRFLVASLVRKSFRIDIVEMLSDMKVAVPLLKKRNKLGTLAAHMRN